MLFQPPLCRLAVMAPQIIQNLEYFFLCIFDERSQKFDQLVGIEVLVNDHPACLSLIGDGREPVSQAVLDKKTDAQVAIPPHKTAVRSAAADIPRDQHIQTIAQQGRIAWQRITGYNLRNYVEHAIQRYKRIFDNTMKERALPQQKTEAWISASVLNRMTNLGMPVPVKI